MQKKCVAYYRVSTARQCRSGLGLEAQRHAVAAFVSTGQHVILREFKEAESGKLNARPELQAALELCRLTGAILVIAKLDRLSRDAAFLLTLRDSGIEFVAADMPGANRLTVGIMALVAEQEREAISKRTREALAAAKRRGVRLGNPNGAEALRRAGKGNAAAIEAICQRADEQAARLSHVLAEIQGEGAASLAGIAEALNARDIRTPRGARWYASSVRNLMARI